MSPATHTHTHTHTHALFGPLQQGGVFKKIRDTKGTFHAKMGSIKDRNGMDPGPRAQGLEKAMAPHSSTLALCLWSWVGLCGFGQ